MNHFKLRGLGVVLGCVVIAATLAASGCKINGARNRADAIEVIPGGVVGSGGSGLASFQSTFYALARTNCATCHGVAQSPAFAVADVGTAYTNAKSFFFSDATTLDSTNMSVLVTHIDNGHCGAYCNSGNANAVTDQLNSWAAGEVAAAAAPSTGGPATPTPAPITASFITSALAVPTTLLPIGATYNGATFISMKWPLSALNTGNSAVNTIIAGAYLEIEIQYLQPNQPNTYRIKNPKIVGLTAPLEISGIHLIVNNTENTSIGGAWTATDTSLIASSLPTAAQKTQTTPFTTTQYPTLASLTISTAINFGTVGSTPANDKIAIGFDAIRIPTFTFVSTKILAPKCLSCHTGAAPNGGGIDLSTYTAVVGGGYVLPNSLANSQLYTTVSGNAPTMPMSATPGGAVVPLTPSMLGGISAWILNGAPNN